MPSAPRKDSSVLRMLYCSFDGSPALSVHCSEPRSHADELLKMTVWRKRRVHWAEAGGGARAAVYSAGMAAAALANRRSWIGRLARAIGHERRRWVSGRGSAVGIARRKKRGRGRSTD